MTNPIQIEIDDIHKKYNENELKKIMLEQLKDIFLQLGGKYAYVGSEYKIIYQNTIYYIDLLLFDLINLHYIAVEVKIREYDSKDYGQIKTYMEIINKTLKPNTSGILINKYHGLISVQVINDEKLKYIEYELREYSSHKKRI